MHSICPEENGHALVTIDYGVFGLLYLGLLYLYTVGCGACIS